MKRNSCVGILFHICNSSVSIVSYNIFHFTLISKTSFLASKLLNAWQTVLMSVLERKR